ncbi:DUF1493 family protein [Erwinia sp. V71]|uniref:DUF1493 family protein n=1 Tax=Erwinia sp. V71 TaxID=3369424 RepID=UPI003F636D91
MIFSTLDVERRNCSIKISYPPETQLSGLLDLFSKREISEVSEFTYRMLIESAKTGRWLYD